MAAKMTKRGALDNDVTYEFMCDTVDDLDTIDPKYIVLGSVAVVIDGFSVYIANSQKEWINLVSSNEETTPSDNENEPILSQN